MINTHPIADYRTALLTFLTPVEGFRQDPYFDTKGIATIGHGFNIETNPDALLLVLNQLGLFAGRTDQEIVNIRDDFRQLISGIPNGDEAQLVTLLNDKLRQYLGAQTTTIFALSQTQSATIFNQILGAPATGQTLIGQGIVIPGKQLKLDAILGNSVPHDTQEYEALMSLFYNSEGLIRTGSQLATAVINGDRAEAWYQIRYNSNNGESRVSSGQGIANRRFREADLFDLYSSGPISNAEAKQILQMYTKYRDLPLDTNGIRAYDAQFTPTNPNAGSHGIDFEISSARGHLIDNFAEGRVIDGEVLVGQNDSGRGDFLVGTTNGDLLFGEQGTDVLSGEAGTDVLYGGAGIDTLSGGADDDLLRGEDGDDTLQGGTGNDLLEGGAGFDTYIYKTGDGNDRIEDSDANGVIIVNGTPLVGGVKKAGHTDWISPDGTLKYIMSGTDLLVQLNGTTILTVNENFQSGQFGIDLIDAPTISTSLPTTTRTILGDFDPLDTDSGTPGVQIDYDELGNVIQDLASPNDRSDVLNGSAGNDTINGGALNDRLTALGGSDILTGGSDNDVLIGQDGNDQLFADQFVNVSGLTTLESFGGTAGTGVNGDFLTGGVNDDVLVGGTGNDALYGGAGKDLVLGGAGRDVIAGDDDFVASSFAWSYSFSDRFAYVVNNAVQLSAGSIVGDDDELHGGAGEDMIVGEKGKDLIYGDDGNDDLDGGEGDDTVFGGMGDDFIQGDDDNTIGNDYLDGGDGADILLGTAGDDTVVGGAGNDILYGEAANQLGVIGNDILDGGDGNDDLYGTGGSDVLYGGLGNDRLSGDFFDDPVPGDDFLYGGDGDDLLLGEAGNDTLDGGDGDDELQGNQGNDTLSGGAGVDHLFGHAGEDTLFGGDGDDLLNGDSDGIDPGIGANDLLDGGNGNDQLIGDGGDDRLFGGAGNDTIYGDTGLNSPIAGNDWLFGGEGNDQLAGELGTDVLDGGTGSDAYLLNLGDGQDEIVEENVVGDVNTIVFGAGISLSMLTFTPNDAQGTLLIQVGSGSDSFLIHGFTNNGVNGIGGIQNLSVGGVGYALADLLGLPGGEIVGTYGNDLIKSGSGNDTIYAGDGNDTITASAGNDLLTGGAGNDTYVLNLGDQHDSIIDTVTATEGNRIRFGAGISAGDLTYTLSADMLTIGYNGTADAVQLLGFNQNTVLGSLVVSTLEFNDGSTVNLADILPPFTNHLPVVANPIADQTAPEDAPWTFAVPTNTFSDEDPGEVLTYSASRDDGSSLPGWLNFDAGTRTFSGTPDDADVGTVSVRVTAVDGKNGAVSDTFTLTVTNVNEAPTLTAPLPDQSATKDVPFSLVVPAGTFADVDPGDVLAYSASLADNSPLPTWLQFNPTTRTFTGTPQFADVGTLNVKVTATDTGSLNVSDVFALTVAHGLNEIIGTAASETLTGTAGNDLIRGLGGSDTLDGLDGNDTLEGGDGDDLLRGGAGSDTLDGGNGNDNLSAGSPGETVANVLMGGAGADRLEGSSGNDTFQGGSGNDSIYDSYGGQNVYLFARGDGQDTIYATSGTIRFASDVLPTDVTVRGTSDGLVLSITGTNDQMLLSDWLNPNTLSRINRVEFANGTAWDAPTLQQLADTGTSGDDYLMGTNGSDTLSGLAGNDVINAYDGNDLLDGGTGNDTLFGGLGNDTYLFGRGAGFDLIGDAGGADKIQLAPGVLTTDVTLLRNGSDLLLSLDQSPTQVRMNNATAIEQITFNDGTIWDAAAIAGHTVVGSVNAMTGTAGNDTFVVDNTSDTVAEGVGQGTDTIQSVVSFTLPVNVENLTLTGYFSVDGTGNLLDNVIIGNSGNNTLVGSVNDYNGGGSDTLQGGLGDDSYEVVGNADTVIEAVNEGTDTITLIGDWNRGWSYTLPNNVENLIVADAGVTVLAARTFTGNALNNVIIGDQHWLNSIDGGLGADTMIGGTFSDTYLVDNTGDIVIETNSVAVDTVMSSVSFALGRNVENLTLTGTGAINGTGNELDNVLTGNSAANVLTGGAGNDTYVIGAGDTIVEVAGQGIDTVSTDQSFALNGAWEGILENVTLAGTGAINATGNAGNNVLTGNSGNNVLDGGAGADQLIGGLGDDTYVFGAGDTIVENDQAFGGIDTVITDQTFVLGFGLDNLTLTGAAAINGTGNELDNVLTGNSAANVLTGGLGNDTYVVDGADTIVELAGEGWADTVVASVSWALSAELENLTLTGTTAINGTGNAQDNVLTGNSGANVLTGGTGNDTYIVDAGDTVVELANQGTDQVMSAASFVLGANVESLTLTGTGAINGTGNALDNTLSGNAGANLLDGGLGADWMLGYGGDDTYVVDSTGDIVEENPAEGIDTVQSSLTYTLGANLENLTLTGSSAINGTGNTLNNVLTGNSAANVLTGGAGNDTYVVGTGDTVTELSGQGTDTVLSAVTWTLGSNLENLTLTGTAAINGTGNTQNNTLVGNSGANVLSGGTGADAMSGGAGDDTYVVDNAGDTVTELASEGVDTVQSALTYTLGANVENLVLTGTTAINGTGNASDNILTGNSGANVLTGGSGNDTYVVGTGDTVTEAAGGGTDTVQSSVTWTLGANLENLTLTGTTAINGTGNTLTNVLTGNSAANILDGGTGADTMAGGAGNDTYVVDNAGDVVTELTGEGTDLVQSAVTFTLGAEVDNLTLTGTLAINGTGNALNNALTGNSGNNVLDGGLGADAMTGGAGNDTYLVDNLGDTVTEAASAGTDTVQSSITYTLGTNLENLTLTGTAVINGTGNTLNNVLVGNSAANLLDGGTGADGMSGGAGDDTYVIENVGDTVTENAGEGVDTVQSALTYTLGANVENLVLTGTTAINGTGNASDNILTGNSGANVLTGGSGNDTYVVGTGDTVTEAAGGGTDTVQSSVTWTLGANLENLTLTGTTAINGTGNTLDNVLIGNSGANVLTGGAGNDTYVVGTGDSVVENASAGTDTVQSAITWTLGANLENLTLLGSSVINGTGNTSDNILAGNTAANTLTGLGGNDTYLYSRGGGQDTVIDNAGTADSLLFGATVNPLDLVLTRQANDLRLAIHGSTDQVTIQNWYGGATNQTETIQAGNGQALLNTQVEQLIQAMATFSQQTGLTWDQAIDQRPQDVQTVLAANWH